MITTRKRTVTRALAMIAAVALGLTLSACTSSSGDDNGSNDSNSQNSADAGSGNGSSGTQSGTLLSKILDRGTLNVGIMPDSPPFGQQQPDGSFKGYDADLANDLAKTMGVKVKFFALTGATRKPSLDSGRTDVDISAFSVTGPRALGVDFTTPYSMIQSAVLYKKSEKKITSFDQFKGLSIGVGRGLTNDTYMTAKCKEVGCKVVRFDGASDAVNALKAGQVDLVMDSSFYMNSVAKKDSSLGVFVPTNPPANAAFIAMGIAQGHPQWLQFLNTYIETFTLSGQNDKLTQKWFGNGVPAAVPYTVPSS